MQDKDGLAKVAAAQVLSGLYEAIADHTQFDSLLQAMDDFLDANPDGLEAGQADWKEVFRQHFGRVGQFLDTPQAEDRESPIIHVDKQVVPSGVINRSLDLLASNELLNVLFGGDMRSLSGCFASPDDQRRLEKLFSTNGGSTPVLVSLILPHLASPIFVVASKSALLDLSGQTGPMVTIKVAKATWNPDLIPLLETAYNLTSAEIEVLEGLVETGSVRAVADSRGRSVRTVRTQLTHIFGKLGLSSQTELALFLATLSQLMTKTKRPSEIGKDWSSTSTGEMRHYQIGLDGRVTSYIKYGDPEGVPVLLIHTTTPPEMIPEFRQMCVDEGLLVIAPHKPGSGGTTARPSKDGPKELTQDYLAILEAEGLNTVIVAGHCSGGVYALEFANMHPQMCKGVILIDTGVPFRGRRDLMALPKSLRRTFLPARYIPEILLVPHRIFAANFQRSAAGEARVIDYFFQDNPVDQTLTRVDRKYYEITRQIIAYSFEDVDRLVADVCLWARDWSHLLEIHKTHALAFVHGEENRLFEAQRIKDCIEVRPNATAVFAEGQGQLQIYQTPDLFGAAVHGLLTVGDF